MLGECGTGGQAELREFPTVQLDNQGFHRVEHSWHHPCFSDIKFDQLLLLPRNMQPGIVKGRRREALAMGKPQPPMWWAMEASSGPRSQHANSGARRRVALSRPRSLASFHGPRRGCRQPSSCRAAYQEPHLPLKSLFSSEWSLQT